MSVYDADTLTLLGAPTVGPNAVRAFAVPDPDNPIAFSKIYVLTTSSVVVLNPTPPYATRATLGLPGSLAPGPQAAALTPDGRKLVILAGGQVSVIRTADNPDAIITASPNTITSPAAVAVTPDSRRAYLTLPTSPVVQILDTASGFEQVLTQNVILPSGALPTAIGIPPNGSLVYVATAGSLFDISRVTGLPAAPITNPYTSANSISFDPDPPVAQAVLNSGTVAPILTVATRTIGFSPFTVAGGLTVTKIVTPGSDSAFLLAGNPGRLFRGRISTATVPSEVLNPATAQPYGSTAVDVEASPDGRAVFALYAGELRLARFDPVGTVLLAQTNVNLAPTGLSVAYAAAVQPSQLDVYGGNNQVAPANQFFPKPLAVRATTNTGLGAWGRTVTFSSTTGVDFSSSTAITNLNGVAETLVRVPSTSAVQILARLSSGGFDSTVTFDLNGASPAGPDGLFKVAGDHQVVVQGSQFPFPLVVKAVAGNVAVSSLNVTLTFDASRVSCPSQVTTDLTGQATISCNALASMSSGGAEISMIDGLGRSLSDSPFEISIVTSAADLPNALENLNEGNINARVRQTVTNAIRVRASKANGSVAEGVGIDFSSAQQDLKFNPLVAVTGSDGIAATSVTFGCTIGTGTLTARALVQGSPSRNIGFNVDVGTPTQVVKRQGDSQSGSPGQRLDGPGQALVVRLADECGNGILDQFVTWAVNPPEAATLEQVVARTDRSGQSSVLVRLGTRPGAFTVTASAAGLTATFSLNVNIVATQLVLIAGDGQSAPAGQAAPQSLTVEARDANNLPAASVDVTFRITAGSGTLSASSATTNAQGRAAVTLTAGAALGTITVVAEAVGRSVTFTITVVGRVPVVSSAGFVNGASFRAGWTPGGLGTIFGSGLMEGVTGIVQSSVAPFPTTLRGVRVSVNGTDAPIISIANINGVEQINIQVPVNVPAPGTVTVDIFNNGSRATFTNVTILAVQPGVFEFGLGGTLYAAALHSVDFALVTPSNPARRGEIILLFLTGLGAANPAIATNVAGPVPPARTITSPVVGLNNDGMQVLGSFYAPGLYTAYQINFVVGQNVRSGNAKLSVVADGVASQDTLLSIQ
jgi:uncharacterized protein (TIGR03437 family)